MGKYLEYFRISFLNIFAYRARYYVGIITYLIYIAIYYYIWKAIYANAAQIDSFSLADMTTYVAIGWISRSFFFNNLDRDMEQKVVDGSLSMDLLKPVDFQGMIYAKAFGESLFRFALFALPTGVVAAFLFPIAAPVSIAGALGFLASTLLAAVIYVNINFMVGTLAIPLKNIEGIVHAKQSILLFLSGLLIPFAMLPEGIAALLKVLPFAGISYVPLNIYLGKVSGTEIAVALSGQAAWAVALLVASRVMWNHYTRRIVIQGG
ncbi:MAG: ABC-2 family transporter protein [Candidatus Sumerlaeaceae bacterium]|nr:ABC-2 family transporter protein [Candidatus Sumerlaeaceae bacterium]